MDSRKRSTPDEPLPQSPQKRLKSENGSSPITQSQLESDAPASVETSSTSNIPANYRAYEFPTTQAHASYIGQVSVPEPVRKLRIRNLPVLDDMANQILDWAQDSTHIDLLALTDNRSQPLAQAWEMLNYSFEGVKAMYAATGGYLSASSIQSSDPVDADSLRRANLAAAVSNLIDPHPFSFVELQKHFWFLFCPPGSEPQQWHADAFLEITARSYASQIQNQEPMTDVPFNALITPEVQAQIRARLPPTKQSDGSERDRPYVKMLLVRCSEIQRLLARSTPASLHQEYRLNGVLRTLGPRLKLDIRPTFHKAHALHPQKPIQPAAPAQENRQAPKAKDDDTQDMLRQAAKAAAAELLNHKQRTGSSLSPQPQQNHAFPSPTLADQATPTPSAPATPSSALSRSMQQQLEAARAEAATVRANARAAATAAVADNQRRPWSAEEENALMRGLESVKGPHWSQILAMYGAGGTVSEILKHRNQVQLKDKARNLKLFFLKNGNTVPEYLKHVTGELRTRAPNSAAANGELELIEDELVDPSIGADDSTSMASMAAAAFAGLNGDNPDSSTSGTSIDMADAVKAALAHVKRPPSQGAQQQQQQGNGVQT